MEDTQHNRRYVICGAVLIIVVITIFFYHSVRERELRAVQSGKEAVEVVSTQVKQIDLQLKMRKHVALVKQTTEMLLEERKKAEEAKQAQLLAEAAAAQQVSRSFSRTEMGLPNVNTSFKAYMDYRRITSRSSPQYRFQQECWTDEQGLRRHEEDYCVALGSYYSTQIGDRFEITLDSGRTFTAVLSDVKADVHTDASHMYRPTSGHAQNLVEFIVDSNVIASDVRRAGTVCNAGFQGNVVKIVKLNPT